MNRLSGNLTLLEGSLLRSYLQPLHRHLLPAPGQCPRGPSLTRPRSGSLPDALTPSPSVWPAGWRLSSLTGRSPGPMPWLTWPGPEFISPKVRKEAPEFFHSWEVPQLLLTQDMWLLVNEAPCCHAETSAEGGRTWVSLIRQAPAAGMAQVDRHNGSSVSGLPSTVSPSQGHLRRPESPGACKLWQTLLRSGEQHPGWKVGDQVPGPWQNSAWVLWGELRRTAPAPPLSGLTVRVRVRVQGHPRACSLPTFLE